ncbi:MAG: hydrogenase nickel incorporation protein HypB [Candidatus Wukongarchaeota archaeon]|nr:hydrogenase nickel incorporation protein HypB [Candidatus Wukongarchaeota archaeon]
MHDDHVDSEKDVIYLEDHHHEGEHDEEDHIHICSIEVDADIFAKLKEKALENREIFRSLGIKAFNIMGSIGCGKTELIVKMSEILNQGAHIGFIAGDVATTVDYERVRSVVDRGIQINTGKECHLDSIVISKALERILGHEEDAGIDILFIENVGNLICPSDFDLGEEKRVVVVSVDQGPWIIRKHPILIKTCDVIVINKADLAKAMDIDVEKLVEDAKRINPRAKVAVTSAKTGEGIEELIKTLEIK